MITPMPVKFTLNKRDRHSKINQIANNNIPSRRVILILSSLITYILPSSRDSGMYYNPEIFILRIMQVMNN